MRAPKMTQIFVHGIGSVSPAGWGVNRLREAMENQRAVELKDIARPGWPSPLRVRQVPAPASRPAFLGHPRLRRASPVTHYAVAAGIEALGGEAALAGNGIGRLGVILCTMTGCVNYSRRFYEEILRDPATASPLVFPETVFNAPSSHIAALLGTTAINYSLVGDAGTFLQGLALAAEWLVQEQADGCLVIGVEEMDWLTSDAFRMFARRIVVSDGAGALYVRREKPRRPAAELAGVTSSHLFPNRGSRLAAAAKMRAELPAGAPAHLLCDGLQDIQRLDAAESTAWQDWTGQRVSPKKVLGEGLMAASAWQCVAAVDALQQGGPDSAVVSVVGCNQQAIGAHFVRSLS
jgi:3-oxoacyl-(acyl-carrier-protein) synthase